MRVAVFSYNGSIRILGVLPMTATILNSLLFINLAAIVIAGALVLRRQQEKRLIKQKIKRDKQ